jgi:phage gp29-like protein
MLLDQFERPIDMKALKKEQAGPTVSGVRSILSGHPSWGLTPERLARLLRDSEEGDPTAYLELAEEMEEKDLHYRGVLGTRKRQVAQLEITVEAATDEPEDVKDADLVRELINRDELQDDLVDVLDALGKGYSVTEIMWDTSGREWRPARFEFRDPRWFRFDPIDGRTLRLLDEAGQLQPLAPFKFIVHQPRLKSGLPIRGGLARAVAWSYLFKTFDLKDWVVFAEIFGMPLRLGKYHPGASEEDKDALLRAVVNISRDAAAIIPESMAIDFPEAGGKTGSVDLFERLAEYLDRQVSKAVLGQTATTDAIKGGYAVGRTHDGVRGDIEQSDARQLAATLNRDLVRPYIDLNRGPRHAYPKLVIGRAEQTNVPEMSDALAKLVPLGLKVEQSVIRDRLGLPDPEEDAEVLAPPAQAAFPALTKAMARAKAGTRPARDETDDLVDQVETLATPILADMVERIRRVVDEAATLEEAQALLATLFPGGDTDDLAEILARAMMASDLQGAADIG